MLSRLKRLGAIADHESERRVIGILRRAAEGRTQDFRTPFFTSKGKNGLVYLPREEIVEILRSHMSNGSFDRSLDFVVSPIEDENMADIGPWSPFLPYAQDGPKKVQAVYCDKILRADRGPYERAVERYRSSVSARSLNRISFEDAVKGTPTGEGEALERKGGLDPTTNSGPPWYSSGWKPTDGDSPRKRHGLEEIFDWYLARAKEMARQIEDTGEAPTFFAVMFQRLVQKGPNAYGPKSKRIVMGLGKENAILGKTFSVPIINARKALVINGARTMIGWTRLPDIDIEMQDLLRVAEKSRQIVVSGDVSNFDASVPPQLILDVGEAMSSWFRSGSRILNAMVQGIVHNTWLITPNKLWAPTMGSVKSGDWGTNILDSGCIEVVLFYGEEAGFYKLDRHYALGDDFLALGQGVTPDSISEVFKLFGLESHPAKQFYVKNALHFLQRLHIHGRIGGIASVMRTLGHALGFEHMEYKPGEFNRFSYVVRALSQVNNCVFNPYFSALVDTLREGDAEELGARFTPDEVASQSGKAGKYIIREDTNAPWKAGATSFPNWPVNGVLRGETLPPPGNALFQRVYGENAP
jgi:hypothetical protein